MRLLAVKAENELKRRLLPFWTALEDRGNGGHFSHVSPIGEIDRDAPRATVFVARLLWTLSAVDRAAGSAEIRRQAEHTSQFLLTRSADKRFGGFFWSVTPAGRKHEPDKHLYAQAFAIFGLAAYARASGDPAALRQALAAFRLAHAKMQAVGGESFSRYWWATPNRRLAEGPDIGLRSMNAHLHWLEALTELLVTSHAEDVRDALEALLRLFLTSFIASEGTHSWSILDTSLRPVGKTISYGHDIEASWLLDAAADALGDRELADATRLAASRLCRGALGGIMDDGSLANSGEAQGVTDRSRIWWVQAEAMTGLLNEYERSGDPTMLDRAEALWRYIEAHILDRDGGEWFRRVAPDGTPDRSLPRVDAWKDPYHQARACLHMMERAARIAAASSG
ncbi:AGE family epimerase/isomerase [Mesorhizobium loti]|nr:AGE family epimerase/isomerase [Mesorhizobium loti]